MSKTYSEKLRDPRWQKLRLAIMNRDNWMCLFCGAKDKTLNIHHRAYKGDPWEVPRDWLVTLCEDCHDAETKAAPDADAEVADYLRHAGFSSADLKRVAAGASFMYQYEGRSLAPYGAREAADAILYLLWMRPDVRASLAGEFNHVLAARDRFQRQGVPSDYLDYQTARWID